MAASTTSIVTLNVGGRKFSSSRDTVCKDPLSMLARMFDEQWAGRNRKDDKGRVFIDRDPRHFGLILNFLRDGACVLPPDAGGRRELLQEADYYQLDSLRAFVLAEEQKEVQTAQQLRACIAQRLELDEDVKGIVGLLVRCAFGRPAEPGARIPGRCGCVEVSVRECAFNPLSPPSSAQPRDETIYVAFQQRVGFEGSEHTEQYEAKHESSLIYEGGTLSYDPSVYGGAFQDRYHIKALQVYEHHCIRQLPPAARKLRDAAAYLVQHSMVVQWALELHGFQDVSIKVQSSHLAKPFSKTGGTEEDAGDLFKPPSPVLANVRFTINLSL